MASFWPRAGKRGKRASILSLEDKHNCSPKKRRYSTTQRRPRNNRGQGSLRPRWASDSTGTGVRHGDRPCAGIIAVRPPSPKATGSQGGAVRLSKLTCLVSHRPVAGQNEAAECAALS